MESDFSSRRAAAKDSAGVVKFEENALAVKNGVFWVVTPCGSCKIHTA
jgi:hypothetical protein